MFWNMVYILPEDYKTFPQCFPDTNISVSNRCFIWGIPRRKFEHDYPQKMRNILQRNRSMIPCQKAKDYSERTFKI